MAVFQDTRHAILVDRGYLALLEHLHEEMHQARLAESTAATKRHLRAALAVADEVSEMLERV